MTKNQARSSRFGPALRASRLAAGLSMATLAQRAGGLTKMAVAQVEGGGGRLDTLLHLAEALGLAVTGRGLPSGDDALGLRLATLRRVRGFSQRAAARRAGISTPTITAIEAAKPGVHVATVERFAAALGASLMLVCKDTMSPWYSASGVDYWTTPLDLAQALASAVGGSFDLDAASPGPSASPIPARRHYTMADDGLTQPWRGVVFLNPPYGRAVAQWIAKASTEVSDSRAHMVVALLPSNTDTAYWHDHIEGHAAYRRFLRGRLRFGNAENGATFGSVIVVWGGQADDHSRIDAALSAWELNRRASVGPGSAPQ